MARTKEPWTGHIARCPELGDRIGRVVLPIELDQQEGRPIKINIALSRIPSLVRQLEKVYDTGLSLKEWGQAA